MPFSSESLLSLTEKTFVREYVWTPEQQIAFISSQSPGVHRITAQTDLSQNIALPLPFQSELEGGGSSFIATKFGFYGLAPQGLRLFSWNEDRTRFQAVLSQEIIHWQTGSEKKSVLARVPPSLGLGIEPRERWLSWISDHGSQQEIQVYSRLRPQQPVASILRQTGWIRHVNWHPHRNQFLYIAWGPRDTPWAGAQLYLVDYEIADLLPAPRQILQLAPLVSQSFFPSCAEAQFSPCGQFIIGLFRTHEWFQFWSYHLSSRTWQQLSFEEREHAQLFKGQSFPQFSLHPDHPLIVGITRKKARSQLSSFRYGEAEEEILWKAPRIRDSWLERPQFSPDGRWLSVLASSPSSRPGLRSWQWNDDSWYEGARIRLKSQARTPPLACEEISWPGIDGTMIHGLFFRPKKDAENPPLIIAIHSGPVEQVGAAWPAKARFYCQMGFAFLYVNYRGSWGYGSSYQQALQGRWGLLDVEDVASAVSNLANRGWIDAKRVALWGGAAGGMTALNCLIRYPRLFRAAIVAYPYLDLFDVLQRASPLKKAEYLWALGTDSRDECLARSPLLRAGRIRTPLLLFHGAKDPLVPRDQVEELHSLLQKQACPVHLKVYEEEAHGWTQESTRFDYARRTAIFLERELLLPDRLSRNSLDFDTLSPYHS